MPIFLFPDESVKSLQVISEKQRGIMIDAICGPLCRKMHGSCRVFFLSTDDYLRKETIALSPRGVTPLLLDDVAPGIYHVGIEVLLSPSASLQLGRGSPFVNDLFEHEEVSVSEEPDAPILAGHKPVIISWRKWYKIEVVENRMVTVMALFLGKQESIEEWERYYPAEEHFRIGVSEEYLETFWTEMETRSYARKITLEQRARILRLLKRGGRVFLPGMSRPTVIFVNSRGGLEVESRLPLDYK